MQDIIIIGCGVTGAACAYELSRYRLRVTVLEANNDVAAATTKANSAILHAGYDPRPGTLMARLNVEGVRLAEDICARLDVPYHKIGSMVLAFDGPDRTVLDELLERGRANGVPGLRLLVGDEARALEPELSAEVSAALLAPTAAIVNPWEYALAMAETAVKNGVELRRLCRVTAISREKDGFTVTTAAGVFRSRFVINAAGVHAGEIHELIAPPAFAIRPVKGEYYLLDKSEGRRVGRVIFQCPSHLGKGVLVSPTVHGNLIVGPTSEPSGMEDVSVTAKGLETVRRLAARSVPGVRFRENIRSFAGVRANSDQGDFIIGESAVPGFFDVAGICSPGLSAAPAIARYLTGLMAERGLALEEKPDYDGSQRRVRFHELDDGARNALIARDPRYGRVVCRCETVTEGEIIASLQAPIPPLSVNGVKRRVGAGMGRCQGGFCGPRVQEIMARALGLAPAQIPLEGPESYILTGETKEAWT
ncbi:MAG: NAD(P)/FAD-dependent oxidoreductase [Oscillospiraceae bacterium]|jgi:glycerol-3-phosphate dehydrogenase|nr:NAD(P)/FAD-dependent oxidoreductase [Oscillospiraceae bacterium]